MSHRSGSSSSRRSRDGERRRKREEERPADRDMERGMMMISEREVEAIKEQYMGRCIVKKKRVTKLSDKFRFSFDWDYNAEDTSRDVNSLYQNPHEANLLFGRGFRAGVDRNWQKKKQPPQQQQHWSLKTLDDMTERDWSILHEDFSISYKIMGRKSVATPIHAMRKWEESKLSSKLRRAVERVGYEKPTPIQMATVPLGLEQRDLIGIAETGSGKTAAFVLPMLDYVSRMPFVTEENGNGPYALVLAPTRELALQIEAETLKLARYLEIKVVSIVGGRSIEEQAFKIRQGCQVVIATPGRLKDCLDRRYIVLNQCNYVVLDEADRMIDMGFLPQVEDVLKLMTPSCGHQNKVEPEGVDKKRTTIMFSATMPTVVEKLARNYLTNPVFVTVGNPGKPSNLIAQHVVMINESQKMHKLRQLLDELRGDKTAIVFVNTKITAERVSKNLRELGYSATAIHGDKSQDQREASLKSFKTNECNILVATDVAGRGIDVPGVAHVINYDMPATIDTYVHHIGRTGRANKSGIATTFLTFQDTDVFYDMKQMLRQSKCYVPPELALHEASNIKPGSIPYRLPRHNDTVFAHRQNFKM